MVKTLKKASSPIKRSFPGLGKDDRYPEINSNPPMGPRPESPPADLDLDSAPAPQDLGPRGAVYTIFTSPNHAPLPDHLPTLIVTPYNSPHEILYTYLHTNFNSEQYLLTPSPKGDLCVARMLPPNFNKVRQRKKREHPPIHCEASRELKWNITNTGVVKSSYLLTVPGQTDKNEPEQPLLKVTKINPQSPFWTMFYFVYAGHQIPPRSVEFGKIQKNPLKDGGGTRVTIQGRTQDERDVWKTLGPNNEDMVEWIVLSAALTVLDDEIIKATEAAEGAHGAQRLRPEVDRSMPNRQPSHQIHAQGPSDRTRAIGRTDGADSSAASEVSSASSKDSKPQQSRPPQPARAKSHDNVAQSARPPAPMPPQAYRQYGDNQQLSATPSYRQPPQQQAPQPHPQPAAKPSNGMPQLARLQLQDTPIRASPGPQSAPTQAAYNGSAHPSQGAVPYASAPPVAPANYGVPHPNPRSRSTTPTPRPLPSPQGHYGRPMPSNGQPIPQYAPTPPPSHRPPAAPGPSQSSYVPGSRPRPLR